MPPRSLPTDPTLILPPLLSLVESNAYSAHQKTRTTSARLISHGHPEEAILVLFEVSKALLKKGETGSGVDLAVLMLAAYDGKAEKVTDVSRGRCTNLIALCPASGNWRKTIIDASVNWTAKNGTSPAGDATLLYYIGALLVREKDFLKAEPHLISAGTRDAGRLLGEMGFEWCQSGLIDPSPYLLRLTLPFLLLSPPSILPARTTLQTFLSLLLAANPSLLLQRIPFPSSKPGEDDDEILFTSLPVANWLQLVVRSVQRAGPEGKAGWSELVGTKYRVLGRPGLRDEHVREAVQIISQQTFKIAPPRGAGGANMLGDLMGSLFGGGAR
ncbi:hypothetical protein BDY24DRAFT_438463 [Mrakia frigida]|uniref:protein GET4 n=1 Tax=Mrakia frigida TaxID=29902 RepID=UPI003FCBFA75